MAAQPNSVPWFPPTLAIVGVGLIGGSIAAAARLHSPGIRIIGIGRNRQRLEQAQRTGLIDDLRLESEELGAVDLVVVATPVDRIVADVRRIQPLITGNALITDAGSVKAAICRELGTGTATTPFVGSHPLAGSEKGGFEHADAKLFHRRLCVVTPLPTHSETHVERISSFWRALGMRVRRMSPEDHDRMLAITSHVPHVVAAALASTVGEPERDFAATGFRDTTRIAGGDPELWTAILDMNRDGVLHGLDTVIDKLAAYRKLVAQGDRSGLARLLDEARRARAALLETNENG